MQYYDGVLLGIFLSMVGGVFIGLFTAAPVNLAVALGAAVSGVFMYHGMFQNAPGTGVPQG